MSAPTITSATSVAPESYDELFRDYYPYVKSLVATWGIQGQNVEDVSMSILSKFYEKSVLEDFDPTHTTYHQGVLRQAKFRTFLSGFVRAYIQHYRNRQTIHQRRECLIMDAPVGPVATWADINDPGCFDSHDLSEMEDTLRTIRAHLVTVPQQGMGSCQLPELFEAALVQCSTRGKVDMAELARTLGVAVNTIRARMAVLKVEVKKALEQ